MALKPASSICFEEAESRGSPPSNQLESSSHSIRNIFLFPIFMVLPSTHLSNRKLARHRKTESVSKAKNLVDRSASPSGRFTSLEVMPPASPGGETKEIKTKFFYSPLLERGDIPLLLQRPLLSLSRVDVKRVCLLWQLPVYPDASNRNLKYARNRLRKQVLPALRLYLNPQLDGMITHFTKLAATEQVYVEYLSQRVSPSISVLRPGYIAFHVGGLTSLPLALRRRILKESLERYVTTSLHLSHVEDISTFLEKSSPQGHPFPGKGRLCLLTLREEERSTLRRRPLRRRGPTLGWATAKDASHCSILHSWRGGASNEQRGFLARYLKAVRERVPSTPLHPPKGHLEGRTMYFPAASLPPQHRARKLDGSYRPLDRRGKDFGVATQCFLPSVGNLILFGHRLERLHEEKE